MVIDSLVDISGHYPIVGWSVGGHVCCECRMGMKGWMCRCETLQVQCSYATDRYVLHGATTHRQSYGYPYELLKLRSETTNESDRSLQNSLGCISCHREFVCG